MGKYIFLFCLHILNLQAADDSKKDSILQKNPQENIHKDSNAIPNAIPTKTVVSTEKIGEKVTRVTFSDGSIRYY